MAWIKFLLSLLLVKNCTPQRWWQSPEDGPTCKNGTCGETDTTCECSLTIEHRLTMMTTNPPSLVRPNNGRLYLYNDTSFSFPLSDERMSKVLTADGYGSRLVIALNGKFPGPTIEAYEDQTMIIHVRNLMHTDSTTIHWHGMHQKGTPGSDGVAFISQTPILPGQTFTYRFSAQPHGSSFYHAHIGDQRSMGLYGGLIIYPRYKFFSQPQVGFTVLLQDWNHDDEPETLYQRMINGVYDLSKFTLIEPTQSIDGANFSRFHIHSALINGKGRFYTGRLNNIFAHNGAPLETFEVEYGKSYRFRVISASTLYPFRVYVQGHRDLNIRASDGFEIARGTGINISDLIVESFIIHPGERYDFTLNANQNGGTYLLVAESIEDLSKKSPPEYHAAEAIIRYKGTSSSTYPNKDSSVQSHCTSSTPCVTFNCPYLYYPTNNYRPCLTFDKANSNESLSKFKEIQNADETLFFNFAFPGEPRYTPGSVNGHQFISPTSPILTNEKDLTTNCRNSDCGEDKICNCTYSVELSSNRVYQFVLTNLGNGRGWSHPIHLHGHYFYVMKMGFGSYNQASGKFLTSTTDIECIGSRNYCNSARWANITWKNAGNSIPGLRLDYPPEKDTIIIPTGGYVIIRFKANNPGAWFFHCHIDLHNTNGMGMVLLESKDKWPDYISSKGDSTRNGTFHIIVLFSILGLVFSV
uniref:L-ascorbate oxidase n=3 Tax=Magallana gigas TaxID=29159 RepID=A0A8W8HTZ5_MAGGI|nr:laccase-4 [Crassostrea gigas]|eukprot:XP_011415330.1 PREDICTED: laccase-4 [Crassostrea gigas]